MKRERFILYCAWGIGADSFRAEKTGRQERLNRKAVAAARARRLRAAADEKEVRNG